MVQIVVHRCACAYISAHAGIMVTKQQYVLHGYYLNVIISLVARGQYMYIAQDFLCS